MSRVKKSSKPENEIEVKSCSTDIDTREVGMASLAYAVLVQAVSDYCNCTERIVTNTFNQNGEFSESSCIKIFMSSINFFISGDSDAFLDSDGLHFLKRINRKLCEDLGVPENELPLYRYLHK